MAMRIGITGATGFLGGHLVPAIRERGWECALLDRTRHNLLDADSLREFVWRRDAIVHLAAVQRSTDVGEMYRVNVLGTKALLDATARFSPGATLVFASSFHVYSPVTHFAHSKILSEEIIKNYGKGPSRFTNSVILRFTNIYGPGGKPFANSVIATFAHQAKEGLPIRINGDGTQRRDYLHASDAVAALMQAVQLTLDRTETVDVCSGRKVSLNTVVHIIGKYSSSAPTVEYNRDAGREDWAFKKNYLRAKRLLVWEPRVTLEQGLKELFTK